MANTEKHIPKRDEADRQDTWDLSKLFSGEDAWEAAFVEYEKTAEKLPSFKGSLGKSAENLADYLDFSKNLNILGERLGYYAMLRKSEDEGAALGRQLYGKVTMAFAKAQALGAWENPEILGIPEKDMEGFLQHERLADYRIYLQKILRYRAHTLSEKEEKIIALYSEGAGALSGVFSALTNADFDFGFIDTPDGKKALSQSTFSVFMESPDRELRRHVYETFYGRFDSHKNALGNLHAGSVKQDVIQARIRGYSSARAAALFPDNVSEAVYDNLISAVNDNLGSLHRYYKLRKDALKLDELFHYDVYAPLAPLVAPAAKKTTTWEAAVDLVCNSMSPLGEEYVSVLRGGLTGRWADRYENKGKRSGAFSAGSFTGDPYILMNYKEDSIRDIFTLAHEGGHSMHSWYSAQSNPFMHYNYSIFEAEVASTFNEELLFRHLKEKTQAEGGQKSKELALYILNKRADDLLATLFRQTMFAEFEMITHNLEETGVPLTTELLREKYRELLQKYFGPQMVLQNLSDLEVFRIPHFYRAFYVYKYATGISASLALAERVLCGGQKEREDYFAFLKSGGSRFPIDSLKIAGVDMGSPDPVNAACAAFGRLVDELEKGYS